MDTEQTSISILKKNKKHKQSKSLSQPVAIKNFYDTTLKSDIFFNEETDLDEIISECRKKGHFFFKKEDLSSWYFIRSKNKNRKCIRMFFLFPDEHDNSKVHNIEKIIKLINDLEQLLIFIDVDDVYKWNKNSVLDVIKNI